MTYVVIVSTRSIVENVIGPFNGFQYAKEYADKMKSIGYETQIHELGKTRTMRMSGPPE